MPSHVIKERIVKYVESKNFQKFKPSENLTIVCACSGRQCGGEGTQRKAGGNEGETRDRTQNVTLTEAGREPGLWQ